MNRQEHLNWCKKRANEYVDNGDLTNAFGSMTSNVEKHPETEGHLGIVLGMQLKMGGFLETEKEMRDWINGFN